MRAWIAGATGYTGQAVAAEVVRQGGEAIAHIRPDRRDLAEWQARWSAEGIVTDATPWELEALRTALRDRQITHVFCCIGTTRKRMQRDGAAANSYDAVDFGLTKLLADATAGCPGVERFVYVSSLGASQRAAGAYLQARWRAECAVREAGVPYTIVRPSFLTGGREESRPAEAAGAVVTDAALWLVGALGGRRVQDRYRSNTAPELARAMLRLATDPAARNREVSAEDLHDPV